MRRLRALCVWMLAFAILFAMSACRTAEKKVTYAYNYAPGTLSDGSMTEERADAYLLANGYPQDFVSDTGSVTKQWLAQDTGTYLIDPTSNCGSFSVKLIKEVDGSDANSDGNNVVQASYFLGDEEKGVNCRFTGFM